MISLRPKTEHTDKYSILMLLDISPNFQLLPTKWCGDNVHLPAVTLPAAFPVTPGDSVLRGVTTSMAIRADHLSALFEVISQYCDFFSCGGTYLIITVYLCNLKK